MKLVSTIRIQARHRFFYLQETKRNLCAQLNISRRQLNELLK